MENNKEVVLAKEASIPLTYAKRVIKAGYSKQPVGLVALDENEVFNIIFDNINWSEQEGEHLCAKLICSRFGTLTINKMDEKDLTDIILSKNGNNKKASKEIVSEIFQRFGTPKPDNRAELDIGEVRSLLLEYFEYCPVDGYKYICSTLNSLIEAICSKFSRPSVVVPSEEEIIKIMKKNFPQRVECVSELNMRQGKIFIGVYDSEMSICAKAIRELLIAKSAK